MNRITRLALALVILLSPFAQSSLAQQGGNGLDMVAKGTDIYCTGFIAEVQPRTDFQIVGAEKENMKATFAQGDVVYLNKGRSHGVNPGSVYYIIRPLGEVKHPFTKKKLGHYVRELGLLRVIESHDKTSTAEIIISCDVVEFGDLLKPYEEFTSPEPRDARPLARYGEGTNQNIGRIVMSRNLRENLSANQVVFLDLGNNQNVREGDYFTIYRAVGKREGITNTREDDILTKRSSGFGSDRYRGGDFSIQGTRKHRGEVLKSRPQIPRKVLGELIVLKVEKNTSVALITRTTAEVNIGDYIERSN